MRIYATKASEVTFFNSSGVKGLGINWNAPNLVA